MAILKPGQLASGSYTISGSFSGSFQGSGAGLNNIPSSAVVGLSSSLNIGTTPIASGTVGRVLFEGTGNVLQQSGNLFWDSTNSRLGIGTSTPSSQIDVFASNPIISTRIATTGIGKFNYLNSAGTSEFAGIHLNAFSGEFRMFANNTYFLTFYSSNAERMRIPTTGNVLINTTTDAGFRLDVNGTARFVGNVTNNGNVAFRDNVNIVDSGQIYRSSGAIALQCFQGVGNNNSVLVNINPNDTTTTNAAILAASSTTKGFLPPRTTLISNISSSIQGLITYVNSGSNEGLYYYNGGSAIGWHKVLTNSGSQSISGSVNLDNTLYVTGSRVGIGTSNPQAPLHLVTSDLTTALYVNTGNDGGFTAQNNGTLALNRTTQVRLANGSTLFGANDRTYQLVNIGRSSTLADFYLQYWDGANYLDRFRIFSTGNVGIGVGTTDAGYRLDVNGTFRATVSTETNPFVVRHTNGNFASIIIGNGSQFAPGQFGMYFNGAGVWSWSGSIFRIHGGILSSNANAITFQLLGGFGGSGLGTSIRLASNTFNAGQFTATSGTQNTVEIGTANNEIWAPSSGNATYSLLNLFPRINTTGTYSGIVRGLLYAPTLTSITGVIHRAIETVTGDVLLGTTSGRVAIGTSADTGHEFLVSGSGASGSVNLNNILYVSGSNVGLGTSTPTYNLDIVGTARINKTSNASLYINETGGSTGDVASLYLIGNNMNWGASLRYNVGAGGANNRLDFYTATSNRLSIAADTGNVLINTTTDAGFKLDVNGTARVQGFTTLSGTITASGAIARNQLINGTLIAAANSDSLIALDINPTFTLGAFTGTARIGARIQNSRFLLTGTYNSLNQEAINPDSLMQIDSTIVGRGGSRAIAFRINPTINVNGVLNQTFAALEVTPTYQNVGAGSSALAINSSGPNVFGTVNVFGAQTTFLGQGGTSTFHYVGTIPNGQGFRVQVNSNIAGYSFEFNGSGIPTFTLRNNNINAIQVYSTGNTGVNTSVDAGFKLDVNGTARVVNNFTVGNVIQNGGNANTFATIINHMGAAQSVSGFNTTRINANTDLGVGFAGAPDASAVVELRGTTKGFLPPRMTGAQAELISSPAEGLMIYATTGTGVTITSKGWWGYDGATWVKFN